MKSIDKFVLVLVASLALLLAGCGGGSSTTAPVDPGPTDEELAQMQTSAIMTAATAVDTALADLSGSDPTQAQIDAVNTAISGLQAALSSAVNVDDAAKAGYQSKITTAQGAVSRAEMALMAMQNTAAEEAAAAMAATAAKLYAGINAPSATAAAVYAADEIAVTIGTAAAVNLSADDDATVAAHHGWEGQMFTAEPDGDAGTYEAVVYSKVGDPTEGAKFNDSANGGYTLDATTGETADVTTLTGHAASRVASPSFDHSAGTKTFELPANTVRVVIAGSYQGVAGTYYCTPTGGGTDCSAAVAASGFTLAGGTWTFKPTDPETRLMDTPDDMYASYGWWLHKSEDGATFTASAFAANRGTVAAAADVTALMGTATYSGGAAGKYALHSSTGGTNDAGHFTADATLEADFGDDMITGTIDNFVGADGEARNWSVELMETDISDAGVIDGQDDTPAEVGTAWTIDGTAGATGGQWRGTLWANGDDGVPSIGTGTFYSEFGRDGRMVGAFGVDRDD